MIDTAGTFVGAIDALKKKGGRSIYGAVTHPLFSGPAIERIRNSQITNLLVLQKAIFNFKLGAEPAILNIGLLQDYSR